MPKIKLASQVDGVPLWDALVVELGDPRPYVPLDVPSSYVVPDGYFTAVTREYDEAWAELDRQVDDLLSDLDDIARDAWAAFDAVYPWPEPPTAMAHTNAGELTALVPAIGVLDQLNHPITATQEPPRCTS